MKKIIALFAFVVLVFPNLVFAVDCPYGQVNDSEPGLCRLYRDTNLDGYCDLSEVKIDVKKSVPVVKNETTPAHTEYHLGVITTILVIVYFLSLFAVFKKKISVMNNRRFWNWLLLTSFLPTAVTTILLVLAIEFGYVIDLGFNSRYWHIIFGWVFLLICIFHTLWHFSYYFKKKLKKI